MGGENEIDLPLAISIVKQKYRQGYKGNYKDFIKNVVIPRMSKTKRTSKVPTKSTKDRPVAINNGNKVNENMVRKFNRRKLGSQLAYFKIREWGSSCDTFVRANPVGCMYIGKVEDLTKAISLLRNVFRCPVTGNIIHLMKMLKESLAVANIDVYRQLTMSKGYKSWFSLITTLDQCLLLSAAFETKLSKRMVLKLDVSVTMYCSVFGRSEIPSHVSHLLLEHLLLQMFKIVVYKKFNLQDFSQSSIIDKIMSSGLNQTVRDELLFFTKQKINTDSPGLNVDRLETLLGYIKHKHMINHVLRKYLNIMRVVIPLCHRDGLELMQLKQTVLVILLLNDSLDMIRCYQTFKWT